MGRILEIRFRNWLIAPGIPYSSYSFSTKVNTCIGGAESNPKLHILLNQAPDMDIKVILKKSHARKIATPPPSKEPITEKYQKRSRASEDTSVAEESELPQPKWRRLKK
ncbi:hypothetical protein PVK06_034381 [Gossypium arboreum]|uniref:Uncharacterized protein n=1 Tax=Gossypium arboreum TaxID=29729 RepID=A0ABR0NDZ2_GOSAR|nr:hypothetical protein PVK06_034381 [Gossypium arboreum]